MYVLCTLAVLTLHSLFKNRNKTVEPSGTSEAAGQKGQPEDGGVVEVWGTRGAESVTIVDRRGLMSCRGEGKRRRGGRGVRNVPDSRKRVQRGSAGGADTNPAAVCRSGVKLQQEEEVVVGGGRCSDDVDTAEATGRGRQGLTEHMEKNRAHLDPARRREEEEEEEEKDIKSLSRR
ncbi:kinesin-like protein KIFC3 isoform X1 [Lates japonicus]|uniref:Kinesin-like protein KIFC3 isoform X1 n=1 Tax=Lates japonicus TaxID=270547 RepID=A0AAD3MKX9_LATJO|nr:kinesin-like protein KIFC3 isoform X1 [Lates japonicus]